VKLQGVLTQHIDTDMNQGSEIDFKLAMKLEEEWMLLDKNIGHTLRLYPNCS